MGVRPSTEEIAHHVGESWERSAQECQVNFCSQDEAQALRQQAGSLVSLYLDQMPQDEPVPLAVETMLSVPLVDPEDGTELGIPLLGIVDLILDEAAGPLVCDFKTAARGGAPLEIMNEVQLTSYAWLLRESLGQAESALEIRQLIKTKTPRVEFHRYESRQEKHFRRLFAMLRAYLEDLDRGRFIPRPGFGCTMCPYAQAECPQWSGQ
jgi:putative RecB family exonuclease